jgi:hypothetical protein
MVMALTVGGPAVAGADESTLYQGLQHLRAGNQTLASRYLARYLEEETDAQVRATVELALLALSQPLAPEGGQLVASNLEESIRTYLAFRRRLAADWRNRNFPVFP